MNRYYNPVRTLEGPGSTNQLTGLLEEMGLEKRKVLLLVWSKNVLNNPGFSSLLKPEAGFEIQTVCFEASNPTVNQLFAVYEATRDFSPEAVVAVGGGSTMDVGKSLCCLYGHRIPDVDALREMGIAYDDTPGVSSFCAAAAALGAEYTLPGVSQSVIITRMEGRTPVPERERLEVLAQHGTSMVLFLSAGMTQRVQDALLAGAYTADTPAAIVYKASWKDEKTVRCTVGTLAQAAQENGISKTALLLIGDFLGEGYNRSLLYHPSFETEFRKAIK